MECAGSGRAHLAPRPVSAPWHDEAIGCAEWTGTPLRGVLEDAGLLDDAVELLFTAYDRGIDQGVEQDYQRSLTVEEAITGDVLLAYAMNGQPLPASHGFPLRLVVPEWYGMASVKWLRSITAIAEPFEGVQQTLLYRYRRSEDEPGTPVTRKQPRALMAPPGIPEFLTRVRHVRAGRTRIEGRAWSGAAAVERVEFSADGGRTWVDTRLGRVQRQARLAAWSHEWEPDGPGDYELCVRATDAAGNVQPLDSAEAWNQRRLRRQRGPARSRARESDLSADEADAGEHDRDAGGLARRDALVEHHRRQDDRGHRIQRAQDRDRAHEALRQREGEHRVGGRVEQPDGRDGGEVGRARRRHAVASARPRRRAPRPTSTG